MLSSRVSISGETSLFTGSGCSGVCLSNPFFSKLLSVGTSCWFSFITAISLSGSASISASSGERSKTNILRTSSAYQLPFRWKQWTSALNNRFSVMPPLFDCIPNISQTAPYFHAHRTHNRY